MKPAENVCDHNRPKARRAPQRLRPTCKSRVRCVPLAAALAALLSSLAPAAAHGGVPPNGRSGAVVLDLSTVVRLARSHSPTLQPSRAAVAGTAEVDRAARVALPTPPRVEVQAGPRVQHGGLPVGAEVTVAAWQDLSLGGYGTARREMSASLAKRARASQ